MTKNHHEVVVYHQTYKRMIRHLQATSASIWRKVHSRNKRHLRTRWFMVAYDRLYKKSKLIRRLDSNDKTKSNSYN